MAVFSSVPGFGLDFLYDENVVAGISPDDQYQQGVSNYDTGLRLENNITLAWATDPEVTWLAYNCDIEVLLDPGIVIHRPLPQTEYSADTLANVSISPLDPRIESNVDGVNTKSKGFFINVQQRMANSEYRFILSGWALRFGYRIPIPGLVTVAGVPAIPDMQQSALQRVVGTYSGIPLWFARWELGYSVLLPPREEQEPAPNLAQHFQGDADVPDSMQMSFSMPDTNAIQGRPVFRTFTGNK